MVVSYTTGQSRLGHCHDGLGRPARPPPRKQWGHRPLALRAIMGLQSTPRPRGSPAGVLVKTREGLAVVPRAAIGPGGREAPRQTVEPRTCAQVPGKLSTAAQQQKISVGQIDHPTAAGTSRPGYAVGDPLLKPPRRLSEGVDNGERIRGSTTCQCDVHQRPRRPSRFALVRVEVDGWIVAGKVEGEVNSGASSRPPNSPSSTSLARSSQPTVGWQSRALSVGHSVAILSQCLLGVGMGGTLRASRTILWCCGWQLATCNVQNAQGRTRD